MKQILIYLSVLIVFVSLTMFLPDARAKDFDFTIKGVYSVYQDRDLLEDGKGMKGELGWKFIYLWGSWERTELRLTGQRAGNVDLFGIGLGGKVALFKPLSIFLEAGYYIPDSELARNANRYWEGVYYKWYKTLDEVGCTPDLARTYTDYRYELKSGFGGSVGLDFNQEIYRGLHLNMFGGYRFLNLREDWDAYHPTNRSPGNYIQTKEKRSFSGGQFGAGLSYKF